MSSLSGTIGRDFLDAWKNGEIGTALRALASAVETDDPSVASELRDAATAVQPPVVVLTMNGSAMAGALTNVPGLDLLLLNSDTEDVDPANVVRIVGSDGLARDFRRAWYSPLYDASSTNNCVYAVDVHDQPEEGGPDAALARIPPYDRNGQQTEAAMHAWFEAMRAASLSFHPEDDPATLVRGTGTERVFTNVEAAELRLTLGRMMHAFGAGAVCKAAYEVALPRQATAG